MGSREHRRQHPCLEEPQWGKDIAEAATADPAEDVRLHVLDDFFEGTAWAAQVRDDRDVVWP